MKPKSSTAAPHTRHRQAAAQMGVMRGPRGRRRARAAVDASRASEGQMPASSGPHAELGPPTRRVRPPGCRPDVSRSVHDAVPRPYTIRRRLAVGAASCWRASPDRRPAVGRGSGGRTPLPHARRAPARVAVRRQLPSFVPPRAPGARRTPGRRAGHGPTRAAHLRRRGGGRAAAARLVRREGQPARATWRWTPGLRRARRHLEIFARVLARDSINSTSMPLEATVPAATATTNTSLWDGERAVACPATATARCSASRAVNSR